MKIPRSSRLPGAALLGGALLGLAFAACASDGAGLGESQAASGPAEGATVATVEPEPAVALVEADPAVAVAEPEPMAAAVAAAPIEQDPTASAEGGLEQWREVTEDEPAGASAEAELYQPGTPPAAAVLGVIDARDNAISQERFLTQFQPWDRGKLGVYRTSLDPEADRAASLAARAALRAFEGAPPSMPHSTSFSAGSKTCLDCHAEGMTIGEHIAHPMSHEPLVNCSQCHVETDATIYEEELILPDNSFEGLRYERQGEASIGGAPPMMPHGTFMRTRCLSCHGEFGYPGLRTEHPRRVNCVQCHITALPR